MSDTIDLTPTWRALIPLLVEVAVNADNPTARKCAMDELYRLADFADRTIAEQDKAAVEQAEGNDE